MQQMELLKQSADAGIRVLMLTFFKAGGTWEAWEETINACCFEVKQTNTLFYNATRGDPIALEIISQRTGVGTSLIQQTLETVRKMEHAGLDPALLIGVLHGSDAAGTAGTLAAASATRQHPTFGTKPPEDRFQVPGTEQGQGQQLGKGGMPDAGLPNRDKG